jgi:hypothetical protein
MEYEMKSRILTLALAAATVGVAHANFVYAVAVGGDLYHIDVGTGASTLIGNTGVYLMESIAYDGSTLYGADSSGKFYTINQANAAATLVAYTGLGNLEGMDFAGSNLWASDFGSPTTLRELNPTTGLPTGGSVTADTNRGVARAMTFNSAATLAYTAQDAPAFQTLQSMDLSGNTTQIGTLPFFTAAIQNIGNDTYIALGTNGEIYSLDVATAGMQLMHDVGDQFFLGVATAPVPEPGTMAVLGLGLAAIARRRRKG